MKNFFKKHCFVIIFGLVLLYFLPTTLALPALTNTMAIITGMSIDKKGSEYSIALQLITPQSDISNNENLEIVDDTGETIFECFNNLSIKLGKEIGLEHANIIILSDSLAGEDIMNFFDYLYRNTKITLSTIIIQTSSANGQKLLETSAELNNSSSSSLQNNLGFSNKIIESSNVTTLGTFYNDYFSYSKVLVIPFINIVDENSGGGESQSQSQSSSGSQGIIDSNENSGSSKQKTIQPLVQNNGESVVYKNGILSTKLTRDFATGFKFLERDAVVGMIKVENVTDNEFFLNSTVIVKIENLDTKLKSRIENNKLVLDVNINISCVVSEIIDDFKSSKILHNSQNYLNKALKTKLIKKVTENINKSLEFSQENNLDIYKIYDRFYKYHKKEFKGFLQSIDNPNEYLNYVEFNVETNITPHK